MEYETIIQIHRKGKDIFIFMKGKTEIDTQNIVNVEICANEQNGEE